MKRSEMINKMISTMRRFEGQTMNTLDLYDKMAEAILFDQDREGMLPPPVRLQKQDTLLNRYWERENG